MSEGDSFLHRAIYDISLVIRDTSSTAKPVTAAEGLIRRFCTKELRGVEGGVEGVEDYVANAVVDLIMMSTWSIAATQMSVDGLPVSLLPIFQSFNHFFQLRHLYDGTLNSTQSASLRDRATVQMRNTTLIPPRHTPSRGTFEPVKC